MLDLIGEFDDPEFPLDDPDNAVVGRKDKPMRKRLVLLALAVASCAIAQQPTQPQSPLLARYQANATTSGAAKITVQATATSGAVSFEEVDIYSSAGCTVTVYINGTPATTTTLAVVGPIGVAAGVPPAAFSASNVGTGTTLKTFVVPASGLLVLDLHPFYFPPGAGTGTNLTVGVSATSTIQFQMVVQ